MIFERLGRSSIACVRAFIVVALWVFNVSGLFNNPMIAEAKPDGALCMTVAIPFRKSIPFIASGVAIIGMPNAAASSIFIFMPLPRVTGQINKSLFR